MDRQPFIVGPTADKVLGFIAGAFAQVLGVLGTVAVMFIWAGSDPGPDVQERRDHAKSVSIWSGAGCFLPLLLGLLLFMAIAGSAVGGPHVEAWPMDTPMWVP